MTNSGRWTGRPVKVTEASGPMSKAGHRIAQARSRLSPTSRRKTVIRENQVRPVPGQFAFPAVQETSGKGRSDLEVSRRFMLPKPVDKSDSRALDGPVRRSAYCLAIEQHQSAHFPTESLVLRAQQPKHVRDHRLPTAVESAVDNSISGPDRAGKEVSWFRYDTPPTSGAPSRTSCVAPSPRATGRRG